MAASSARLLHTWAHPRLFFFLFLLTVGVPLERGGDNLPNSCTIITIPQVYCVKETGRDRRSRAGRGGVVTPTVGWIRMASSPPSRPFPLGSPKEGPRDGGSIPRRRGAGGEALRSGGQTLIYGFGGDDHASRERDLNMNCICVSCV